MDILISSNLERLLYILCGRNDETINDWFGKLKTEGKYTITDDVKALIKDMFYAGCCDDTATAETIKATFDNYNYLADTHTSVALNVCDDYIEKTGDKTPVVVASTASPFKFSKAVLSAVEDSASDYDEFATVDALEKISSLKAPDQLSALKGKEVRFTQVTAKEDMADVVFNMLGI
jgi:threonine synthase